MEMPTESVRELRLKRRRARVPWIYLVYHRHEPPAGTSARSVLPPKKRRNVERRGHVRIEFVGDEITLPNR